MTEPEVAAADKILRAQGIRYVVVGGQAVAQKAATTTRDVDVMVATVDYASTVARLRQVPDLAFDWDENNLARFRILSLGGVPLDIINPTAFAGNKDGAAFFRYLLADSKSDASGIAYSSPELVWYTRLLTKRWKSYAEKIVTNVIDGVPPDRLARVEGIARQFGTEATIKERVAYVREELSRPDVSSLIRKSS